jgi:CubicO group peptidase (beta-lactamase class C family)
MKTKFVIRLARLAFILAGLITCSVSAQLAGTDQQAVENHLSTGFALAGSAPRQWNILDRMKALHVPGASVAVIHKGTIEWAAGYGVQQIGGSPVDTSTLFEFASVSKAVTAVGVMRLAQGGRIDLDRDINTDLKRWKVPGNQWTEQRA